LQELGKSHPFIFFSHSRISMKKKRAGKRENTQRSMHALASLLLPLHRFFIAAFQSAKLPVSGGSRSNRRKDERKTKQNKTALAGASPAAQAYVFHRTRRAPSPLFFLFVFSASSQGRLLFFLLLSSY
jgi:hypothetical protein